MWYIEDAIHTYECIKKTIQNNICWFYIEHTEFRYEHRCGGDWFQRICKKCNIEKLDREILRLKTEYNIQP